MARDKVMARDKDEWDEEWDRMSHSSEDYRREIRELRDRIFRYVEEIAVLRNKIDLMRGEISSLEALVFRHERET